MAIFEEQGSDLDWLFHLAASRDNVDDVEVLGEIPLDSLIPRAGILFLALFFINIKVAEVKTRLNTCVDSRLGSSLTALALRAKILVLDVTDTYLLTINWSTH